MVPIRPVSLLAACVCLSATGFAQGEFPVFSITWRSFRVGLPDTFVGLPVNEGDVLAANSLFPIFGPQPPPGILETSGLLAPTGLWLPGYIPCFGHPAGTPCSVEVDALSHALDAVVRCPGPGQAPPAWLFSVSFRGFGDPSFPSPSVFTEAACGEEPADVFYASTGVCGPQPIIPPFTQTGWFDGNGLANCAGTGLIPGVGLTEPIPGDDLDALDENVPDRAFPRTTCTYFSLDSGFLDPMFAVNNSNSAAASGFVGGDVLVTCPGAICNAPQLYAAAAQLGLDLGGLNTDDLDALVLHENGTPGYQRSSAPYDWLTGATDMLFFSVRRGSAVVGQLDSFWGLPIDPADVLVPNGPLGTRPGIWVAGETLGLNTIRSGIPGVIPDDLDALDTLLQSQFGGGYCFGDGSGTPCPCANSGAIGRGCANSSNTAGGLLWSNGFPSISNDTVTMHASGIAQGLPGAVPCLLFQGTAQSGGGLGVVFGDGLRCVQQNVKRWPIRTTLCGNREWGFNVPGDLPVSVVGAVTPGVRYYQVWYRDAFVFCTPAVFSFTNGYVLMWAP